MAMKIGGGIRIDWLQKRHWERLARLVGIKPRLVVATLTSMAGSCPQEARALQPEFEDCAVVEQIVALIDRRYRKVQSYLA